MFTTELLRWFLTQKEMDTYEIYISRASEVLGVLRTREIYEQAIKSGLPNQDVKTMCLKYAKLEKSLGEMDRARGLYIYASQLADPRTHTDMWNKWHKFEVQHGNEETFREMLRIKRTISASRIQQNRGLPPEYLVQKDQRLDLDAARDKLKEAGITKDEMAALEKQLAPAISDAENEANRRVGFVSASMAPGAEGGMRRLVNNDNIELPEESDLEKEEEKVEIVQKDVPLAAFNDLVRKRELEEQPESCADVKDTEGDNRMGALERIKRQLPGKFSQSPSSVRLE